MAALLHDVMEDCGVTKAELIERFGAPVADLVDGLTKLDKLRVPDARGSAGRDLPQDAAGDGARRARHPDQARRPPAQHAHAGRDARRASARASRARRSRSTRRSRTGSGLNQTYRELQDLSFQHLHPVALRARCRKAVKAARGNRRDVVEQDPDATSRSALDAGQARGAGLRPREDALLASTSKMREKHLSFAQVIDIFGFRIVVPTLPELLHRAGRAAPAVQAGAGQVQGLHRDPEGRTATSRCTPRWSARSARRSSSRSAPSAMHAVAEAGVAAHWLYKASGAGSRRTRSASARMWLQSLLDIQNETRDASEFLEHVKVDLFPDAVYVFTPKGKILALPRGATRVDFAYAIHTDVGDHCVAGQDQRRAGAAAHRAAQRRRGRDHHRARRAAQPGVAQLRAHRQGALEDPPLPEEHGAGGVAATSARSCWRRRCAPKACTLPGDERRRTRRSGSSSRAGAATAAAPTCYTDIGLGRKIATIVAKRLARADGRARLAARPAHAHDGPLRRRRRSAVAGHRA